MENVEEINFNYSLIAEQSVLGALLLDSNYLEIIIDYLPNPSYFYIEEHRIIYSSILALYSINEKIDYVTIFEKIITSGEIEKTRCKTYLLELAQIVPSISNIESYSKIVKEKYNIRCLIESVNSVLTSVREGNNAEEILDFAEQKIYDIRSTKSNIGFTHIKDTIFDVTERINELSKNGSKYYTGLSSGFSDLDRVIMGLNNTDLILIAARPGMGKTSFALNIALMAAKKEKAKVAIFSLEMSKDQLVCRIISTEGQIEGTKLKTGRLSDNEWERLMKACEVLRETQIHIDDSAGINILEMRTRLRKLKNIDLVIIDYLQLISQGRETQNRVQEISSITRQLKIMAKELKVPVICLSQLSRASEHRTNHRPLLSDLRDSGSIEQDADIVMFLYRESYYTESSLENNDNLNKCECIIAKNRHGEICTVDMFWQGEFTTFTSTDNII